LGLFVVFVYNVIWSKNVFQNYTQKKNSMYRFTLMFFSENHRNIDVRPRGSVSTSEQRRPLRASRDTGASGHQVNASTSQDEEHQQPVEPEQGDTEASPATHPLY